MANTLAAAAPPAERSEAAQPAAPAGRAEAGQEDKAQEDKEDEEEDEGPQAPSLLRLLLRDEAHTLTAFLSPMDLAELLCVQSCWGSGGAAREAMWQGYFLLRYGMEHGAGKSTKVHAMRSWANDTWPGPWPLTVGFCGAMSASDHLFWFLPFLRQTLCVAAEPVPPQRRGAVPLASPKLAWQVACRVRARPGGTLRLARCFVCDVLEVSPPNPTPQHFRRRWARPCAGCARTAHRACLERRLLQGPLGAEGPEARSRGSGPSRRGGAVRAGCLRAAADRQERRLRCEACGSEYRDARRFPETLTELLGATVQEWRWVLRRCLVCAGFFVWMYSLVEHYFVPDGVSRDLCVLLAFTACMMSVTMTQRFHRGIQMIWNTPNRWRYFHLFGLFVFLFHLVSFRSLDPALWAATAARQPWLLCLHEVHSVIHRSFLGTLVLGGVSVLYVATASGIIFLFWKTSLRVPTVADVGDIGGTAPAGVAAHEEGSGCVECGLCQLGLCLDNTCM